MKIWDKRAILLSLCFVLFLALMTKAALAKDLNILMFLWDGETEAEKGFRETLAEEFPDQNIDQNIDIKVLDAYKDKNRLEDFIDKTDDIGFQLIYSYGSLVTSQVTKAFTNTPIVFNVVYDPIGYKIVESWDQKGPNITGISNSIPLAIEIETIQDIFGKGDIGFIYSDKTEKSFNLKEAIQTHLASTGDTLITFEFKNNLSAFRKYLDQIKGKVVCIYCPSDRNVEKYFRRIFTDINRRKIPSVVTSKSLLQQGALMCMSAEYHKLGKRAGKYAAKILRGTKASQLPILRPSRAEIAVYANASVMTRYKIELPKDKDIIFVTQ